MKKYTYSFFTIFAVLLSFSVGMSVVKEPEVRKAKIEIADKILGKKVALPDQELVAEIGDPFKVTEEETIEVDEEIVEEEISAHELIPLLARNVDPTGIFSIGGEYYLMFKEDRVKSGGTIAVEYKNNEYNLEIVKVLRNAYSLRLEDAELEIKLK